MIVRRIFGTTGINVHKSDWLFQQIDRVQDDPADVLAKKDRIYWFRFDPTDKPTPPHLEADLAWVIPVMSISLFFFWQAQQRLRERIR